MSITNPGFIPDENLEIPSDFESIEPLLQAAIMHVLQLYPDVSESRLDSLIDLTQRSFRAGIEWYNDNPDVSMRSVALSVIPSVDKAGRMYDPEDLEHALLAMTAGIDWYVKQEAA